VCPTPTSTHTRKHSKKEQHMQKRWQIGETAATKE